MFRSGVYVIHVVSSFVRVTCPHPTKWVIRQQQESSPTSQQSLVYLLCEPWAAEVTGQTETCFCSVESSRGPLGASQALPGQQTSSFQLVSLCPEVSSFPGTSRILPSNNQRKIKWLSARSSLSCFQLTMWNTCAKKCNVFSFESCRLWYNVCWPCDKKSS